MIQIEVTPMKTGETCPCCGQPIKTRDKDLLYLLGWIRATGNIRTPISLAQLRELEAMKRE